MLEDRLLTPTPLPAHYCPNEVFFSVHSVVQYSLAFCFALSISYSLLPYSLLQSYLSKTICFLCQPRLLSTSRLAATISFRPQI